MSGYVGSGWSDGSVRVFKADETHAESDGNSLLDADAASERPQPLTLSGHRGPVTSLAFHGPSHLLATGGSDGKVVVWDVVDETGRYRLSGHRGVITGLRFYGPEGAAADDGAYLLSASLDGYVKVWDLHTQRCVQTVVGHRGQVLGLDVFREGGEEGGEEERARMVTCSEDRRLRVWRLSKPEEVRRGGFVEKHPPGRGNAFRLPLRRPLSLVAGLGRRRYVYGVCG